MNVRIFAIGRFSPSRQWLIEGPEPDLLWLRSGRYRERHPAAGDVQLAIEVSDSGLQRDLDEKPKLHVDAGLVEFRLVDATAQWVHVFRTSHRGQ